jgi:hypothetical protein
VKSCHYSYYGFTGLMQHNRAAYAS